MCCPVAACPVRPLNPPAPTSTLAAIKIGFDLGGVLIDRFANDKSGFNFLSDEPDTFLRAAAVQGAFDGVYAISLPRINSNQQQEAVCRCAWPRLGLYC